MLSDLFWLIAEYFCITLLAYIAFCVARLFFADRVYPHLGELYEGPLQEYAYRQMIRCMWFFGASVAFLAVCYIAWSWRFAVTSSCLFVLRQILVGPSFYSWQVYSLLKLCFLNIQSHRAIFSSYKR